MSYYADPYARPPPAPYEQSPYSAPPPLARPPPISPPPLPAGWHQEWEPSMRRAFWVEDTTGRAQWETPYAGEGYYESRSGPGFYEEREHEHMHGHGHEYREEGKHHHNAGKYLAAGMAGLAVGGVGGAVVEHEIDEGREEERVRHAYEEAQEERYEDEVDDAYE